MSLFFLKVIKTQESHSKPVYPTPDTSSPAAVQTNSPVVPQSYSESPPPHQKSVWILAVWQEVVGRLVALVPRVTWRLDRDSHPEPVYPCVCRWLADSGVNPAGGCNRFFARSLDKSNLKSGFSYRKAQTPW